MKKDLIVIRNEIAKKLSKETGHKSEDIGVLWDGVYRDDVLSGKVSLGRSINGTKELLITMDITGCSIRDMLKLKE